MLFRSLTDNFEFRFQNDTYQIKFSDGDTDKWYDVTSNDGRLSACVGGEKYYLSDKESDQFRNYVFGNRNKPHMEAKKAQLKL